MRRWAVRIDRLVGFAKRNEEERRGWIIGLRRVETRLARTDERCLYPLREGSILSTDTSRRTGTQSSSMPMKLPRSVISSGDKVRLIGRASDPVSLARSGAGMVGVSKTLTFHLPRLLMDPMFGLVILPNAGEAGIGDRPHSCSSRFHRFPASLVPLSPLSDSHSTRHS